MKKYYWIYAVMFFILIVLLISGGIPHGIALVYRKAQGIDDVSRKSIILVFNMLIMLICFVVALVVTISKNNAIKIKWVFPVLMLIVFAFIPISLKMHSGGIIYQKHRELYSVIEFVKEGEHEVDERFEECVEEGRWLDLIK